MEKLKVRNSTATKKAKNSTKFGSAVSGYTYDASSAPRRRGRHNSADLTRSLSYANNIARICIQIIKDVVLQTEFTVTTIEGYKKEDFKDEIYYIENLLHYPNENDDTYRSLFSMMLEDLLVIDRGVIEKVRNVKGEVVELYPVIGNTIYPQYDNQGILQEPAYLQYLSQNSVTKAPDAEFEKNDLLMFIKNPQQGENLGYGKSVIDSIVESIISLILATNYNSSFFTSAKLPPAVVNLKAADVDGLAQLKEGFEAELRRGDWPIVWTNAEAMDFQVLRQNNQDMQFAELYEKLVQIVVSAFGLSIQDVGLIKDVNRATAEVQNNISKNRGISTTLSVIQEELNHDLIYDLAQFNNRFGALKFSFLDIDKLDEKTSAEVHKIYIESGVLTANEVRKELGKGELEEPSEVESEDSREGVEEEGRDPLNISKRLAEIEKSVRWEKISKASMDFGDDAERQNFPSEDKVDFDFLSELIEGSEAKIFSAIENSVNGSAERVKNLIMEAVRKQDPRAAATINAISPADFVFEISKVLAEVTNGAFEEASREIKMRMERAPEKLTTASDVDAQINADDAANKLNTNIKNLAATAIASSYTAEQVSSAVDSTNQRFLNVTGSLAAGALVAEALRRARAVAFRDNESRAGIIGYTYSAKIDSKTTNYCRSMDGKQFTLDSPGLSEITPPNHFRCRSILVPVLEGEPFNPEDMLPKGFGTLPDFKDQDAFAPN